MTAATILASNYYRSEARVVPLDSKAAGGIGQLAAAAAAVGISVPGQDGGEGNYLDILQSRWIQERLLQTRFQFWEPAGVVGHNRWHDETLITHLQRKDLDAGVRKLREHLGVSRDPKSNLILIYAETQSPELSQQIVRTAMALLQERAMEAGKTRGGEKAHFASSRLEEARRALNKAEEVFRDFLEKNRNYLTSSDPYVRLQGTRFETEIKLRQQLLMTIALNHEQALLEEKNDLPLLNVIDPPNLPVEKSRPARSIIVLATFAVTFFALFLYKKREWIIARIAVEDNVGQNLK